ncbi:family 78 glycoside hydrolase catalytic domain [Pedobacter sp. HDW13]|uniref:alpha-L-rhamnosidase n=1 Tax=Pedobacter sp. HDW13 TaxID=2714940 RepID=UPI00140A3E15|nr:alpha-L-rhamnosidase [Pedobacter sp. HDW13]QIL41910.1 family 78 glycoside hydrolase catalytic domain [Pedobacter sp. HDW13]
MNIKTYISIIILLLLLPFQKVVAQVSLQNLKCEMLVNPLGIDVTQPRLSWEIISSKRNVIQKAYQVLVASTAEKLAQNEGDLWNSGKVNNEESIHVKYNGQALTSRMRCYWKVKTWTTAGESEWSAPNSWTMGLLNYKDWPKGWIGFDRAFPWDNTKTDSRLSVRYFRKEFQNTKKVKYATASIIGLGLYQLYLNGKKVGEEVLTPSPTDYNKNVKYNTYDVTSYLQEGKNAVGAVLGNGRFFAMRQNEKPYKIKTFGFPKMLLNIRIVYSDGSTANIDTDDSWKGTADGPIRANNEYDGEEYDATKEAIGWNKAGFDDSKWLKAEFVQEPLGTIEAQMNENMRVMNTLKPLSVKTIPGGRYLLDMGQNMVGWLQIKVKGQKGKQVKLRFAESLQENGELFTANLRNAKCTDLYTFKGNEAESWEPTFAYRGFRYVEISGLNYTPSLNDFTGKMIYDKMNTVGTFETSNALTNQIFKNAWWGIAGNYKGIPIDCPQRNERMPWLGDRGAVAHGENFLFDNGKFYAKWLQDIRNAQKEDGAIPDVAPAFWRYYSDNMSWPGSIVLITEMLYKQTGDVNAVTDNYPAIKKWLRYMQERYMKDYILTKDSYGDWCMPPVTIETGRGKSADKKYPSELISTAYYYHFTQLMMQFSQISGNDNDYKEFKALGDKIKAAFNQKFYNEKGFYASNNLTDNIIPLYFGMVPEANINQVFKNIVYTVEVTNKGHLSNGLVGVQWLMRCLNDYGRSDLAYTIATQKTYPGWGYMIDNGATTIWELWNGNTADPKMNSQNHVMMLGDLLIWYYENLAGIKAESPAFKKITMKPEMINGLDQVTAGYHSAYGLIKSSYSKTDNKFNWKISIPANTTATLYIPAKNKNAVTESLGSIRDLKFIKLEKDRAIYEVGSGDYEFVVEQK